MANCRLLSIFTLLTCVSSQVIDMGTGQPVDGEWFETGSIDISTANWVPVTASLQNYKDPVVFLRCVLNELFNPY
jgi:hypothetical protein